MERVREWLKFDGVLLRLDGVLCKLDGVLEMSGASESDSYPRPMLTVDVAVFACLPESPSVLLVQRAHPPFAGSWALPGGFVEAGEQVADAAPRELAEETGAQVGALELLGVYDTPGRDPRGWTVSVVYLARVPSETAVVGADDARDARWFAVQELPELAFDHGLILGDAIVRAQSGL